MPNKVLYLVYKFIHSVAIKTKHEYFSDRTVQCVQYPITSAKVNDYLIFSHQHQRKLWQQSLVWKLMFFWPSWSVH